MNLGPGKEFDRIRAMMERIAEISGDESELGDDCAIIPLGSRTLAVSIDASLEGVHFRTEWLDFKEIGFRAAGAALSDLAADGATPFGLMVSLGVPDRGTAKGADPAADIMAGIATMANNVESRILGGDLTRAERYSVDVCVLGTVDRPVRRTGAREGDALWVTGYLGGAALALQGLLDGKRLPPPLRNRYACPEPRLAAGRWLADHGATAMIDISDGLAADAQHLSAASEVGLEINLERIPCWDGVAAMAAIASGAHDAYIAQWAHGTCLRGAGGRRGGVRLLDNNKPVALPAGYDHFAQ